MHNALYQHLPLLLLAGTQSTCDQGLAGHHAEMQNPNSTGNVRVT